jgi:TBC1 domain family protein 5
MNDAMKIWDGLFACDPTFELAQWVCAAMLIRIRNECDLIHPDVLSKSLLSLPLVLSADYSGQLTVLLHYPSPRREITLDGGLHHTSLLLRQAMALQMSPTPSAGAALMMENRNLLSIPAEDLLPSSSSRRNRNLNGLDNVATMSDRPSPRHSRQQTSQSMGLPEIIARGLLERGESLGINKTLMSAVTELRVSLGCVQPRLCTVFHVVTAQHTRSGRVIGSFARCVVLHIPP